MDGGQKINISLESPLDTKSSDMLVSINETKFAHNRQKFQGHVLPNSLRYEQNGWAAGWYVYNFDFEGGCIFSETVSDINVPYMAVSRTELNKTPTHILKFNTAKLEDGEKVIRSGIEFKAWLTSQDYVSARECKEAYFIEQSDLNTPKIHFNYAVDDVDCEQTFDIVYDPCTSAPFSFSTTGTDLSIEFEEIAADGLVTAILNNNNYTWQYQKDVYVPKDLYQDEIKFVSFDGVNNGKVTWKYVYNGMSYTLTFENNVYTFAPDNLSSIDLHVDQNTDYITGNQLTVKVPYDVFLSVPLKKYYAQYDNLMYSSMGSNALFNAADTDAATNRYIVNMSHITEYSDTIHDKDDSMDIPGPDISLVSALEVSLADLPSNQDTIDYYTANEANIVHTANLGDLRNVSVPCVVPIFNTTAYGFKLPGSNEEHDVAIQIYFKYNGGFVNTLPLNGRDCRMSVLTYPYAEMQSNEPIQSGSRSLPDLQLNGKYVDNNDPINLTTVNPDTDKLRISQRTIWGRHINVKLGIKGVNGVSYTGNDVMQVDGWGVNSNLIFSRYQSANPHFVSYTDDTSFLAEWATGMNTSGLSAISGVTTWSGGYSWSGGNAGGNYSWSLDIDGTLGYGTYGDVGDYSEGASGPEGEPGYNDWGDIYFYGPVLANDDNSNQRALVYNNIATAPYTNNKYIHYNSNTGKYALYAELQDGGSFIMEISSLAELQSRYPVTQQYGTGVNLPSVIKRQYISAELNDQIIQVDTNHNVALMRNRGLVYIYNEGHWLTDSIAMNFDGTSSDTVTVPGAVRFWTDADAELFVIQDSNGNYFMYDGRLTDYWLAGYETALSDESDTAKLDNTMLAEHFVVDVMDLKTGKLLIDHEKDVLSLDDSSALKVYLRPEHLVRGNLFYYNAVVNDTGSAYGSQAFVEDYLSKLYSIQNKSNAFLPVCKYKDANSNMQSIYASVSGNEYGNCQGIAVFNTDGAANNKVPKLSTMMYSPLKQYALPPVITSNKLTIYAQRTYTNVVQFDTHVLDLDDSVNYISDSDNTNSITIKPRSTEEVFTYTANDDIECNNKYYEAGSLLKAASVTYMDNSLSVMFQVSDSVSGSVLIDGSEYSLNTAELSVKLTAKLLPYYLPEYSADTKYQLVYDSNNTVNHKTLNDIRNSISDLNIFYAKVNSGSLIFNTNSVDVALGIKFSLDESEVTDTIEYNSTASGITYADSVNSNIELDKESSSDAQVAMHYTREQVLTYNLPELSSASFDVDITDNKASLVDTNAHGDYNYMDNTLSDVVINDKEVIKADVTLTDTEITDAYTKYTIDINQAINTRVAFKYKGIYKIDAQSNTDVLSIRWLDTHTCAFKVKGKVPAGMTEVPYNSAEEEYVVDFRDFDDPEKCTPSSLIYKATDVRTGNTKQFAKVMSDSELQIIKQRWESTVAIENFWWLDENHIMELTKDRLIVREKIYVTDSATGKVRLHDWNGDNWQDDTECTMYNRTDYITSEADTVLCSSAKGKGVKGYLYILSAKDYKTLNVKVYDPINGMSVLYDRDITFKTVELGEPLNEAQNDIVLTTYSAITITSILSDSKFTAVNINGDPWLGIQYDNNFNQWSICLSAECKVVQGYGAIGINGYATGGVIPSKYFGNVAGGVYGFNNTVLPIKSLEKKDVNIKDIAEFNMFDERVVGDDNQQWYISESLDGIIISVNLSNFNTVSLPITNKYAQIYSSPSFARYDVCALGLSAKPLMNLFEGIENPIWKAIVIAAGYPILFYLSPYTNVINYLQQTIGQYAYVHYNTTSVGKKSDRTNDNQDVDNAGLSENTEQTHIDALLTDDLSFDVQHIAQEQSFKDNAWDGVLGVFASMVISATEHSLKEVAVNTMQNQSAVSDIGRKFSQAFMQNIGSMSTTGFTMQSSKPMLKSEVTAIKTLDMFYSTSAGQECYAGPGFTNANFVAQCVAQSATSVQLEAQQTQIFLLLKDITLWQVKLINKMFDIIIDNLIKQADEQASGPTAGLSNSWGWIVSLVLSAVALGMQLTKYVSKLAVESVSNIIDAFFPNGLKTNVTAQLSRHNYDIEGKHAYGNKSEHFFWPCADCTNLLFTDESVEAVKQEKPWPLEMPKTKGGSSSAQEIYNNAPANVTVEAAMRSKASFSGSVEYNIASCKGTSRRRALPVDIAYVIGTDSFMPNTPFRNDNIGEGEPVFTPPAIQDYVLDKNWSLFITATAGDALWISCKDTKLFDGNYSNVIVNDDFCGIAAPHVAVELKHGISKEYLRPWAVTPDAIALNVTGLNCAYDEVAYHAFDGYGYRITDWLGSAGMNKERYSWQYCFQINDRFKRSNKLPPNQFMGDFQALPAMSLDIKDKVFNEVTVVSAERGLRSGVTGENKDQHRYALPIFTEQISTLPAIVRALSPYKLAVIEGITSLTTEARSSQNVYKIPDSIDFNINDKLYRMTNEYICSVEHSKGLELVKYLVPALGLTYLGATPFMAYFYNQATRQYYIYQGGNTLQAIDMLERFRDIKGGYYDFINQEVIMPCLATFDRLDAHVKDDSDETDNIIIPVFRHNKVGGEITPPVDVIFNTRSWYRTIVTPAGVVFQGPNRCIINRFVWSHYMLEDIKRNKGKWVKVPREEYHPFRKYAQKYVEVAETVDSSLLGWTHNPFLLVTAPLGIKEEADCKFEWEITFAWTTEMEQLYENNEYVVVNVMAETMCPGGKKVARPTHIFLTKDLFTRSDNVGYYSFRYQSNAGAGNRERLHIWSDGYIAISGLQLECKQITERRNEILTIQEDVKGMKEM